MPEDPTPDPTPEPVTERTFTQDDVNRILAEQKRKLLAEQPDLTELRSKAQKYDELEAQSKSELDREREARAAAERERDEARAAADGKLLDAAIRVAAAQAKAVDPDAVAALLDRDGLKVGADGRVDGLDDAIKTLLEAKPYLTGSSEPGPTPTPTPGGADGGPRGTPAPGQLTRDDLKSMTPDQIVEAKAAGRLNDLMGVTP